MTNEEHLKFFLDENGLTKEFVELLKREEDLSVYYGANGTDSVREAINLPFRWPDERYWDWSTYNEEWRTYLITHDLAGSIQGSEFLKLVEPKCVTNEQIFIMFLQKNRVLTKFRRNHKRHASISGLISSIKPVNEAVGCAFGWSHVNTEQPKHVTWSNVHRKWLLLVDEFKLKGRIDLSKI